MKEYIEKNLSVSDLENELLNLIKKYNQLNNRFLIIYASAIGKPIPDIVLTMDDYYVIYDILRNEKAVDLDFYLETPGGSGEAAEEIVRFLRSKFDTVNFVVSGEAKSAGTILVLSGDEIFMTNTGSLGPIDAQVKIGRSFQSAYDYIEWVKEKQKSKGRLTPFDALIVSQITPGELKGVYHSLNFAKDCVVDWLPKYKYKNWTRTRTRNIEVNEKMKKERAKEVVDKLLDRNRWRMHGRSIKINDLEEIGLQIKRIDDDPEMADIVYRIQIVIKLIFNNSSQYKLFATENNIISKSATSQKTVNIPSPISHDNVIANVDIRCPKCGKQYKLFAKFTDNKDLEEELRKKGLLPFPESNKLVCTCGQEINLLGVRNEIEGKIKRKIVI